jgi:hypothetical protein
MSCEGNVILWIFPSLGSYSGRTVPMTSLDITCDKCEADVRFLSMSRFCSIPNNCWSFQSSTILNFFAQKVLAWFPTSQTFDLKLGPRLGSSDLFVSKNSALESAQLRTHVFHVWTKISSTYHGLNYRLLFDFAQNFTSRLMMRKALRLELQAASPQFQIQHEAPVSLRTKCVFQKDLYLFASLWVWVWFLRSYWGRLTEDICRRWEI